MHKILIVDDHPETLNVTGLILRQNGYEVVTASNGLEALAVAQQQLPHLVLLDMMMPGMSGTEVCRRLREIPQLERVPVIMFSVSSQVDGKWAGFEAGADDYLVKPTDPKELVNRIATLLSRSADGDSVPAFDPMLASSWQPQRHGRVILFIGARGGVGTTTAAIHLAATLVNMGQPTLLVDFDMVQGHIALYLKQKITAGLNTLTRLDGVHLKQELASHTINYQDGWQLLLTEVNLDRRLPFFNAQQVEVLIKALMRPNRTIVVDLGCGVYPFDQPLLAVADDIFVCLRPDRMTMTAARLLLRRLAMVQGNELALQPLMLDFFSHSNLSRRAVEDYLSYPLAGVVPISMAQMAKFVNNAQLLTEPVRDNPTAAALRQIAERLAIKTVRYSYA
jgi:DNA-binding response OmpR family regulator